MPIIINNSTGLAENLDQDKARSALEAGSHSLPLYDPKGNPVSVQYNEAKQALANNFRQPDQEELDALMRNAEASSTKGQIKAGATAFMKGATLGISPVVQTKLGISTPQELQDLAEANPGITTGMELAGLGAASLLAPEFGAAGAMTRAGKAGEMIARAAGATGAGVASRMAVSAGRMAAETALYQTGDEISKQLVYEPEKSVAQSVADVGLSALLGAATGAGFVGAKTAVNPLWKATKESKLAQTLGAIKSRFDGAAFVDDIDKAAAAAGLELTPEIRAMLSKDATVRGMVRELSERANTKASKQFQSSLSEYKEKFNKAVLDAVGKTEADVGVKLSAEGTGEKVSEYVNNTLGKRVQEMREKFKPVYEVIEKQAFPEQELAKMSDELTQAAMANRWHEVRGMGEFREVKNIVKSFSGVKTFKDFDEILSATLKPLYKKKMGNVADVVYSVAKKYEENAERLALNLMELPHMKALGPKITKIPLEEVQAIKALHGEARSVYKGIMDDIRELAPRLGLKQSATSPEKFLKALNATDMKLLGQRALQDRSEMYSILKDRFPGLEQIVAKGHLDAIPLKKDANGLFKAKDFIQAIRNMPPEKQAFVLSEEMQNKLSALGELSDRLGKTKEVRQLDRMLEFVPGGAAALTSLLISGSPVHAAMYFALGQGVKKAATEIPDAIRMSMLKMLASDQPISGKGFKSMFDFANSVYRGAQKSEQAMSNLFKPGAAVLTSNMAPSAKSLNILEKTVFSAQTNPEQLFDKEDDLGYYMPESSMHVSALSGRAISYLDSLRPKSQKLGPLDKEAPPNSAETAKYRRALAIAEQPLVVLQSIKDGTLTPQDVTSISTLYPSMYEEMKMKMLEKIAEKGADSLSYKSKLCLSLFMGQPMDSSTNVNNIATNQAISVPPPPQQPKQPSVGFKAGFEKLPNIYATPRQLRERNRNK